MRKVGVENWEHREIHHVVTSEIRSAMLWRQSRFSQFCRNGLQWLTLTEPRYLSTAQTPCLPVFLLLLLLLVVICTPGETWTHVHDEVLEANVGHDHYNKYHIKHHSNAPDDIGSAASTGLHSWSCFDQTEVDHAHAWSEHHHHEYQGSRASDKEP